MTDSSNLSFALTYAGTLVVAVLMFLGQVIAFAAVLVLAGTLSFLASAVRVVTRRRRL